VATLRSIVGAALWILGGLAVVVAVWADRWRIWREQRTEAQRRAETEARAEQLRARVADVRRLADEQAAAVAAGHVRQIDADLEEARRRDPVDVANKLIEEARRGRR
jgi:hypothetical protein